MSNIDIKSNIKSNLSPQTDYQLYQAEQAKNEMRTDMQYDNIIKQKAQNLGQQYYGRFHNNPEAMNSKRVQYFKDRGYLYGSVERDRETMTERMNSANRSPLLQQEQWQQVDSHNNNRQMY